MKEFVEKLIERLKEKSKDACVRGDLSEWYDGKETAFIEAIEIVKQLSEEHNNGWILCSDRLPKERFYEDGCVEPSDDVLVLTKYNSYKVSRYWGNRRNKRDYYDWVDIKCRKDEVVAWKPIAPYVQK